MTCDTIENLLRREDAATRAYRAAMRSRSERRAADAQRRLWQVQVELLEARDRVERGTPPEAIVALWIEGCTEDLRD